MTLRWRDLERKTDGRLNLCKTLYLALLGSTFGNLGASRLELEGSKATRYLIPPTKIVWAVCVAVRCF